MNFTDVFKERKGGLFDYLDGIFWTLGFACPADEAFFNFYWDGFSILYFINAYGAHVDTCTASGAFVVVNHYFYHFIPPFN